MNADIAGLDQKLVPIDASSVRICKYANEGRPLIGTATLISLPGERFTDETNELSRDTLPPACPVDTVSPRFFLTFASDTERVHLAVSPGCQGGPTNGVFIATPTFRWGDEITRYTSSSSATPRASGGTGPISGPGATGPTGR